MHGLLGYCRQGFDPELAAELQAHADEYRQLDAAELVAQGLVQP